MSIAAFVKSVQVGGIGNATKGLISGTVSNVVGTIKKAVSDPKELLDMYFPEPDLKKPVILSSFVGIPSLAPAATAIGATVKSAVTAIAKSPTTLKTVSSVLITTSALALTNPKLVTPSNLGTTAAFALSPKAAITGLITKEVSRQKEVFNDPNISMQSKLLTAGADLLGIGAAGTAVYATGKYFGSSFSGTPNQKPKTQPQTTGASNIVVMPSIPSPVVTPDEPKPKEVPAAVPVAAVAVKKKAKKKAKKKKKVVKKKKKVVKKKKKVVKKKKKKVLNKRKKKRR